MSAEQKPDALPVVAWGTTRTLDGKQILSEMCVSTNPAYVKTHNHHAWEALVRLSDAQASLLAKEAEIERLNALINSPHIDDWMTATKLEAAHQVERWSASHDAGKQPEDWFWLLGYLGGKAVAAFRAGNTEKGIHHIVSSSAALLNWHRNVTGENTAMRPGIDAARAAADQGGA